MSFSAPGNTMAAGTSVQPVPQVPAAPQPTQVATDFALVNGTPNILSLTVPNDGKRHTVIAGGGLSVSVTEVGGNVGVSFTRAGTNNITLTLVGGAQANGTFTANSFTLQVDPGSTVLIFQQSALTGGAAVVNAFLKLLD